VIITPSTRELDYIEIPFGSDHQAADIDWTTPQGQVPGHFKVWIPRGVLLKIGVLIFGAGNQYGTICLNYGRLPGPWNDQGPFPQNGSVPLDRLNNTVFQFSGNGQVVWQFFSPAFPGGGVFLYGAVGGGNPYKLQVVKDVQAVVTPPVPTPDPITVKKQEVTLKPGVTHLVIWNGGRTGKIGNQNAKRTVVEF